MEIRKQLHISTVDPFTLLEVCQFLREMPCGEGLELVIDGDSIPEELFKIIPPERYEIERKKSDTETEYIQVVIHKTKTPPPGGPAEGGGWCCK